MFLACPISYLIAALYLKRFRHDEVVGEPIQTRSNFIRGYVELPVVVHPL